MRILHIITRLIVGGAQENTLLTCAGLQARGHEVILLTGPSPGPEGTLMRQAETGSYQVIVTPHLVRAPHPWHDWQAYRQIKQLCRDLHPDVVHTHSSKAGIVGRLAAWPPPPSPLPPPRPALPSSFTPSTAWHFTPTRTNSSMPPGSPSSATPPDAATPSSAWPMP